MKKTLLAIVVVCILAVPAAFAQSYSVDLGAFDLVLADDFQHNNNYIGRLQNRDMLKGHRIQSGETYRLTVRFRVSRDLEQNLLIGFADVSPAANFWLQLSWNDGSGVRMAEMENIRAGQEYTGTFVFRTLARATGTSPQANTLLFITEGEGRRRLNGGARGPVTIHFTQFTLTRD